MSRLNQFYFIFKISKLSVICYYLFSDWFGQLRQGPGRSGELIAVPYPVQWDRSVHKM